MIPQAFGALLCFALLSGCGKGRSEAQLQGQVTINGEPIAEGRIDFVPAAAGQGSSTSAAITAGHYQADTPVGPVRVFFHATQPTGQQIDHFGDRIPETINIVPPRYQSGIEIDIAAGSHAEDFPLESE